MSLGDLKTVTPCAKPAGLGWPPAVARSTTLPALLESATYEYLSGSSVSTQLDPEQLWLGFVEGYEGGEEKEVCKIRFPNGGQVRVETHEWADHGASLSVESIKIVYRPHGRTLSGHRKSRIVMIDWQDGDCGDTIHKEANEAYFGAVKTDLGLDKETPPELVLAAFLSRAMSLDKFRERYYSSEGADIIGMPIFTRALPFLFGRDDSKSNKKRGTETK